MPFGLLERPKLYCLFKPVAVIEAFAVDELCFLSFLEKPFSPECFFAPPICLFVTA